MNISIHTFYFVQSTFFSAHNEIIQKTIGLSRVDSMLAVARGTLPLLLADYLFTKKIFVYNKS